MPEKSSSSSERGIAQQTQEKFEFYLLSLVFTLLALSIQTAKFGVSLTGDILELLGWGCFIVSGLAGLSKVEWTSIIRLQMASKSALEEEVLKLKELQLKGQSDLHVLETGKSQSIAERIDIQKNNVLVLTPHIENLERCSYFKYNAHKYGFVLGILCVAASRAYEPAYAVIRAIGWL